MARLQAHNSPKGLERLNILAHALTPQQYERVMNGNPLPRIKEVYELTVNQQAPANSQPLSAQIAQQAAFVQAQAQKTALSIAQQAKPAEQKPYNGEASAASTNISTPTDGNQRSPALTPTPPPYAISSGAAAPVTDSETEQIDSEAKPSSFDQQNAAASPAKEHTASDQAPHSEPIEGKNKAQKLTTEQQPTSLSSTLDSASRERKHDIKSTLERFTPSAKLPLFREEERNQYDIIFDTYTTTNQQARKNEQLLRESKIMNSMLHILKYSERKTGFENNEKEAKLARNAIVAVQYTNDGDFYKVPNDFDPQTMSYHLLMVDTRLLFEDSAHSRAHEMVDLLYRLRAKEGDAQKILDMTDKEERRNLIRKITDGRSYTNTPIALPTTGIPADTIKIITPEYINASPEEREKMIKNIHYAEYKNVDEHSQTPYLLIKGKSHGRTTYQSSIEKRKERGYDIEWRSKKGDRVDSSLSKDFLKTYSEINSIHGGSLDKSLPVFKDKKGNIINPEEDRFEYARRVYAYLDSSLQAILHEAYHSRTNAPLQIELERKKNIDENDKANQYDIKENPKVPGAHPIIYAAEIPELLNAVHALKLYVREYFPDTPIQNIDDFDFLKNTIWRSGDPSRQAARFRATIPRDARILFILFDYAEHRSKIKAVANNIFIRNKEEIQKKHPELKDINDIFSKMPEYVEILMQDKDNKKKKIHEELVPIIKGFYYYKINNMKDEQPLFRKWFIDNKIFQQAKRSESQQYWV